MPNLGYVNLRQCFCIVGSSHQPDKNKVSVIRAGSMSTAAGPDQVSKWSGHLSAHDVRLFRQIHAAQDQAFVAVQSWSFHHYCRASEAISVCTVN